MPPPLFSPHACFLNSSSSCRELFQAIDSYAERNLVRTMPIKRPEFGPSNLTNLQALTSQLHELVDRALKTPGPDTRPDYATSPMIVFRQR